MKTRLWIAPIAVSFAWVISAAPAQAQATRTWVSGVGDDANPCSRTAPCKTFAGAISKTATGGEINCLDPGGFGGVTITKSLSIVCQYTEGGVLSAGAGVNGIVVNAPATSVIYLRGLDLHGAGNAQNGVRFIAGASLTIEDSVIRAYNATNGLGISFQPSGSSQLVISNTSISNNGSTGGTGGGILIQPTGASGSARVTIINSNLSSNAGFGIKADSTGNTGPSTVVALNNTRVAGNTSGVVVNAPPATTGITMTVLNSVVFNNSTGLSVNGGTTQFAVGGSTIVGNLTEMSQTGGGALQSFGNNYRAANNVPGTFAGPAIPPS
jgi:hypothetical protein